MPSSLVNDTLMPMPVTCFLSPSRGPGLSQFPPPIGQPSMGQSSPSLYYNPLGILRTPSLSPCANLGAFADNSPTFGLITLAAVTPGSAASRVTHSHCVNSVPDSAPLLNPMHGALEILKRTNSKRRLRFSGMQTHVC